MENKRLKTIKEGGKEYILASQVPDFAKEHFGTSFSIPSYRSIRYYVTEGIIERPLKNGRETYFETQYILDVIELIRELQKFSPTITWMKRIISNARKFGEFGDATERLKLADNNWLVKTEGWVVLFEMLSTRRPSEVKISEVEKKMTGKKLDVKW